MNVRIRLFAVARQLAGADSIEVELADGQTVGALRRALARQFPSLDPLTPHMMFALGTTYADDATIIPAGADVACIPPVSGG